MLYLSNCHEIRRCKLYIKRMIQVAKQNYRRISILPDLRKVSEILMHNQVYPYFDAFFSKFQCGFRKGFNAQYYFSIWLKNGVKSLMKHVQS